MQSLLMKITHTETQKSKTDAPNSTYTVFEKNKYHVGSSKLPDVLAIFSNYVDVWLEYYIN
jgi:hypothetical protein